MAKTSIAAPTGTRDLYPIDAARRRFITEAWRGVSIRHGFEEIDGPTFEHLDLYTVKSGEGIVSELFAFQRAGGEKDYALRPEFTPTLARMYAARAGSLPKPTKWFMAGPFFRAERPQRGRLREFLQWNADILGDASPRADAEILACCIGLLKGLGFTPKDLRVKVNHRSALAQWLESRGLAAERHDALFKLLDKRGKIPAPEFVAGLAQFGFVPAQADVFLKGVIRVTVEERPGDPTSDLIDMTYFSQAVTPLVTELTRAGVLDWIDFDLSIVRGLAYYTGMVFEVHEASGAERAIAGGGRYDGLVELFGGPPTPAVGFGMGDVVLSLVMEDRGLMPQGAALAERAGARPDVYVASNGDPAAEDVVAGVVATLRDAGLHARHTYKATRNVGKLLQEAAAMHARLAIIIESAQEGTLKALDSGLQERAPLGTLVQTCIATHAALRGVPAGLTPR
jgi:histidyl-tRNA synthetase